MGPAPATSPGSAPLGERDGNRGAASALATTSSAAPAAPAPIEGGLPPADALALSNKASCPTKTCRLEGSLLEAILGAAENRAPVGIWEEDIGAGAAVTFARRPDMDVLGVALAGTVSLAADESKTGNMDLTPWHAFVAPGSGITLRAKGGPARLVLVVAAVDMPASKAVETKAAPWTSRPAPIASLDLGTATDLAWGKGAYHARIGFSAEASPHASIGILKMSADGAVAPHVHEKEWEHMAILQGEGDFILGTGEEEHAVHASNGATFSVPPATRHQWKPAGSRSFLGIQVYTPPGPEQRFKKLAAGP
jgi:mannose-6-phosphate isomerase-like protein (cupin superfamily)